MTHPITEASMLVARAALLLKDHAPAGQAEETTELDRMAEHAILATRRAQMAVEELCGEMGIES